MKHKRLNRDAWGFQYYPYYQMRIDHELFHGLACLIRFTDGENNYWQMPKAGSVQVTGSGMTWLQLVPDGTHRVITVMYFPDGSHGKERKQYPVPACERYQPSVWYMDVIENLEYDEDGVAVFVDKYLDVIMSPEGDIRIDDRDELDSAFASGELSKAQYDAALEESGRILQDLCSDIRKTDEWCALIRQLAEDRIARGEPVHVSREVRELKERRAGKKVMVSACLIGENCKYSGGNNLRPELLSQLSGYTVIPVCPEVLGGLPVPRVPAEIVNGVVLNREGVSVDEAFRRGAEAALEIAGREKPDLIILQSRSPSCGVKEVYDGTFSGRLIPGQGVFAGMAQHAGFRVMDVEDILSNGI